MSLKLSEFATKPVATAISPNYMPRVIEERFDGITSCRWELDTLVYQEPWR